MRTEPSPNPGIRLSAMVASCFLVAVAGFYLLTEHVQHTLGALPYVILLACPLLHLFMHRGHGGHGSHGDHPSSPRDGPRSSAESLRNPANRGGS